MSALWSDCLNHLQTKVSSADYNTWLRPLQATLSDNLLTLYAHNQFVANWVQEKFLTEITELTRFLSKNQEITVLVRVGNKPTKQAEEDKQLQAVENNQNSALHIRNTLNPALTLDNFVQGKSNQLAKMVAQQIAANPGDSHCNPFSLYGSTGLGKTHLLHAIGNAIIKSNPQTRVVYKTAEKFQQEMVKGLQSNTIDNFKRFYRSLDVLILDDIQFLAKKPGAQEEFFHTFNYLFERGKQVIVASDVFPKDIENIEDRIKSRLTWGINSGIEPPELETRARILIKKAEERGEVLHQDVAYFIAQKLRTNVRELEGALKRLLAFRNFTGREITIDFARETLKDILNSYEKLITIENIQNVVATHYNIKQKDLISKSRTRSIARPRQIAMTLAKELTNHSLPEIGREFGGRDHTTVMHACKTIHELRDTDSNIQEDYTHLIRKLSS